VVAEEVVAVRASSALPLPAGKAEAVVVQLSAAPTVHPELVWLRGLRSLRARLAHRRVAARPAEFRRSVPLRAAQQHLRLRACRHRRCRSERRAVQQAVRLCPVRLQQAVFPARELAPELE
jgi:hypothetical protein